MDKPFLYQYHNNPFPIRIVGLELQAESGLFIVFLESPE